MTPTLSARIYRPTPRNLARLARVLAQGGLVATPSETVYGLAADALNSDACRAIFKAKGRPANDPLIVHVSSLTQAAEVAELSEAARKLAKAFWPGPLTLVLPKKTGVPHVVTSGLDSVAVRMPAHRLFQELIRRSGRPLAAPSANPFGYVSPTTAVHVREGLGGRIRYILDGGACKIGVESTILDLRDPTKPALLRPGVISREALARVLGRTVTDYKNPPQAATGKPSLTGRKARNSNAENAAKSVSTNAKTNMTAGLNDTDDAAIAPGLLESHYSPRTPLSLVSRLTRAMISTTPTTEALLFISKPQGVTAKNIFWLTTRSGDLVGAAHRLFDQLRQLDGGGWTAIHTERAQGTSALALAINDRLSRAAAKR